MRVVSVMLFITGIVGLILASMMFGDIGIAAMIGAFASIISGVGFYLVERKFDEKS